MNIEEKTYVFLCTLFAVFIVAGNLIYQKFILLPVGNLYTFELSAGALIYPLTFLLTDLITEFYGKTKAQFCVKLAIIMNIIVAVLITVVNHLDSTAWSKITNAEFNKMFGFYSLAFIGSILANYIAQSIDIVLYLWIRKMTRGKLLWLRNNGSTAISLMIDTWVVITFLTAFRVLPSEQYFTLITNSYLFKLFFTLANTPVFYAGVYIIRFLQYKRL